MEIFKISNEQENIITDRPFNVEKHFLGNLCARKHDYQGLGKTQRFIKGTGCIECLEINRAARDKPPKGYRAEYHKQLKASYKLKNINRTDYPETKTCSKCGIEKASAEFNKDTATKSGLRAKCKSCCKDYQNLPHAKENRKASVKRRYYENYEHHRDYHKAYRSLPKMKKWIKDYEKCEKRIAYNKSEKRVKANKEFQTAYYKTERGRLAARKKFQKRQAVVKAVLTIEYSLDELIYHFEKFGVGCFYCGKDDKQTLDHFIPYSKGGPNCIANLIPACVSCNSGKSAKEALIWFRQKDFYILEKEQKLIKILSACVDEIKQTYPEAAEIISKGLNL